MLLVEVHGTDISPSPIEASALLEARVRAVSYAGWMVRKGLRGFVRVVDGDEIPFVATSTAAGVRLRDSDVPSGDGTLLGAILVFNHPQLRRLA